MISARLRHVCAPSDANFRRLDRGNCNTHPLGEGIVGCEGRPTTPVTALREACHELTAEVLGNVEAEGRKRRGCSGRQVAGAELVGVSAIGLDGLRGGSRDRGARHVVRLSLPSVFDRGWESLVPGASHHKSPSRNGRSGFFDPSLGRDPVVGQSGSRSPAGTSVRTAVPSVATRAGQPGSTTGGTGAGFR